MTQEHSAYKAEALSFRLLAYSGAIVPDCDNNLAVHADRDVIDTSIEFAIKARRWFQNKISDKNTALIQCAQKLPLTHPIETNFQNALHGIIHSTYLFSDMYPVDCPGFPRIRGKKICGIMFETDKYPCRSVGLEALAMTYLSLRHPNEFGSRLEAITK